MALTLLLAIPLTSLLAVRLTAVVRINCDHSRQNNNYLTIVKSAISQAVIWLVRVLSRVLKNRVNNALKIQARLSG